MDRFKNSQENEYAWCQGDCGRKFHYSELDENGRCQDCHAYYEATKKYFDPHKNPFNSPEDEFPI